MHAQDSDDFSTLASNHATDLEANNSAGNASTIASTTSAKNSADAAAQSKTDVTALCHGMM